MVNLCLLLFYPLFTCVDPDLEYGPGSTKLLNTYQDPQHWSNVRVVIYISLRVRPRAYEDGHEAHVHTLRLLKAEAVRHNPGHCLALQSGENESMNYYTNYKQKAVLQIRMKI